MTTSGGGFRVSLKRFYYFLGFLLLNAKYFLIQILTRHRKFNWQDYPSRMGQVAVITGGTRGIGYEVIKTLLRFEMHVIMGCRNVEAGEAAVARMRAGSQSFLRVLGGSVKVLELDLASLDSVNTFANTVIAEEPQIHILINAAGIALAPYQETVDGLESHFQVNYLSHFLLTQRLLPLLRAAGTASLSARIINLSSVVHYNGKIDFDDLQMRRFYSGTLAYCLSKQMQLISAVDMKTQFARSGDYVKIISVHPGQVYTDIFKRNLFLRIFAFLLQNMLLTPEKGADCVAFAALSHLPEIINMEEKGRYEFLLNSLSWKPKKTVYKPAVQEMLWKASVELSQLDAMNFKIPNISGNQNPIHPKLRDGISQFMEL